MKGLILLDAAAIRRLQKAVGSNLTIMLYVADWLMHLNVFTDAQIYDILNFAKTGIEQFDSAVAAGKLHPTTLGIHDSRWVSYSGKPSFLDTKTADEVMEMPCVAVTHIVCDLVALHNRMLQRENRYGTGGRSIDKPATHDDQAG